MKNIPYEKYHMHKIHAAKRNVEFQFSFDDWHDWWRQQLGPDWLKLRGRREDQFVMARVGDVGPYCRANVKCITNAENRREQYQHGKCGFKLGMKNTPPHKNGIKITPDQALAIYNTIGTQRAIAAKFGVSERLVRLIKNKQVWQSVLP